MGLRTSENAVQSLLDRHGLIFVKPVLGGVGKKGKAGLIGKARTLYFCEHRHLFAHSGLMDGRDAGLDASHIDIDSETGSSDPTDPAHGIDLKATAFARQYRNEKRASKTSASGSWPSTWRGRASTTSSTPSTASWCRRCTKSAPAPKCSA